jgi:hypothetical protein
MNTATRAIIASGDKAIVERETIQSDIRKWWIDSKNDMRRIEDDGNIPSIYTRCS